MRDRWTYLVLSLLWSLLLWNGHGLAKPSGQTPADRQGHLSAGPDASHPPAAAPFEYGKRSPKMAGPGSNGPEFVFRGVRGMPPGEIKRRGGLLPNNVNPKSLSSEAYKLTFHLQDATNVHGKDSAYVSTTSSFEVAAWFARAGGYVYVIKTTPNMVPVGASVDSYSLPWEREYSAMGGVVFEQIAECVRVPEDGSLPRPAKPNFKERVEEDLSRNMDPYRELIRKGVLKPDNAELRYDGKRFAKMSASPGQPQLAGYGPKAAVWERAPYSKLDRNKPTWEYAHEFMASIGADRGWSDKFPLFQSPAHEAKIKAEKKEKQEKQETKETKEKQTKQEKQPKQEMMQEKQKQRRPRSSKDAATRAPRARRSAPTMY